MGAPGVRYGSARRRAHSGHLAVRFGLIADTWLSALTGHLAVRYGGHLAVRYEAHKEAPRSNAASPAATVLDDALIGQPVAGTASPAKLQTGEPGKLLDGHAANPGPVVPDRFKRQREPYLGLAALAAAELRERQDRKSAVVGHGSPPDQVERPAAFPAPVAPLT